jgi:hypothetical protein
MDKSVKDKSFKHTLMQFTGKMYCCHFHLPIGKKQPRKEPDHWREVWAGIEAMRNERPAPVDTMGCHALSEGKTPEVI